MNELPALMWFLAKGAFVFAGACVVGLLLRRSASSAHVLLWRAVTVTALLLLPAAALPSWWVLRRPALASEVATSSPGLPTAPPPGNMQATFDLQAAPGAPPAPAADWRMLAWLYGAGVILSLAPLFAGIATLWRWRRLATPPSGAEWLEEWRAVTGDVRAVVLVNPSLTAPLVSGLRHATLWLPVHCQEWSAEQRRTALAHEAAHVQRRDVAFQWLGVCARALHWPNPLAWTAFRALVLAQERRADDSVLAHGVEPSTYARWLVRLAEGTRSLPTVASPMARPGSLESRLRRILDRAQPRHELRRAWAAASGLFIVTATILLGGLAWAAPPTVVTDKEWTERLEKVVIPKVELNQVTASDAMTALEKLARAAEPHAKAPLTFRAAPEVGGSERISVSLTRVPLEVALRAICDLSGLSHRLENGTMVLEKAPARKDAPAPPAPAQLKGISAKLALRIPAVDMTDATLEEAVEFLRAKSRDLDRAETAPSARGVNFILRMPPNAQSIRITFSAKNVPLSEAIRAIADAAGMKWSVQPNAVVIERK